MVTDLEIAQLLLKLYQGPEGFDHYEAPADDAGICWALKRTPDADVILLRGSTTFEDWTRDLMLMRNPFVHEAFGPVHPGFEMGMERASQQILSEVQPGDMCEHTIVAGHSLGAGRAAILTALMIEMRVPPIARVVFGEPRPGYSKLAQYVKDIPARSYRNVATSGPGHDLITDVPITFPLAFPYVHAAPLIDAAVDVPDNDPWGPFRYHHMELYVKALEKEK